jgi:hypothetical protein
MKKIFCFLLLLSVVCIPAFAQRMPSLSLNKVRISGPDKTIVFEINPAGEPAIERDRTYYWYSANQIHTTQGGFSGHLLNGGYQEFYLDKSLKEQGTYKKGTRSGEWKTWNTNGSLGQVITWKNGVMQGSYGKYNDQGVLLQSGKYKNNLLNGKQYTYHGSDPVQVTTYKAGKLIPVPVKTSSGSFFKKLWPFHKKQGNSAVKPVKRPKKVKAMTTL